VASPASDRAIRFRRALWLLPTGFAAHELEEWRIHEWYQRHWTGVVPSQMTPELVHAFLLGVTAAFFAWTLFATRFRNARIGAHLLLVPFVLLVFGHGFFHVGWMIVYGAYDPGAATALLVIPPLTFHFLRRAVREGFLSRRLAWSLVAAAPLFGLPVLLGGNVVPEGGLPHIRFTAWVLDLLG
jgi:hypothetical protein